MKKFFGGLILAAAMCVGVFNSNRSEAQTNFNYATNTYVKTWAISGGVKACIVQECLNSSGSGCTTPGSAQRGSCVVLGIIYA